MNCKYYLPCGWCDRKNEPCNASKTQAEPQPSLQPLLQNKPCIEHEWYCSGVDTAGWTYTCSKCHQIKRENYAKFPSITPVWINPEAPDINKVGDFPPYYDVTCTSGYVNTNKCPSSEVDSILTSNVTTSASSNANKNTKTKK